MKTEQQIKERIASIKKEKAPLLDEFIRAIDQEQQNFYSSEIVRYDFMLLELEWVLK